MNNMYDMNLLAVDTKPSWADTVPLSVMTWSDVVNMQTDGSFYNGSIDLSTIPWILQQHALYASFSSFVGVPINFEDQVRAVFLRALPNAVGGCAWKQFFNNTKFLTDPTPEQQQLAVKVLTMWENHARSNADEKTNAFSSAGKFARRMDIEMEL